MNVSYKKVLIKNINTIIQFSIPTFKKHWYRVDIITFKKYIYVNVSYKKILMKNVNTASQVFKKDHAVEG